jgi:hypothetical protein
VKAIQNRISCLGTCTTYRRPGLLSLVIKKVFIYRVRVLHCQVSKTFFFASWGGGKT